MPSTTAGLSEKDGKKLEPDSSSPPSPVKISASLSPLSRRKIQTEPLRQRKLSVPLPSKPSSDISKQLLRKGSKKNNG